MKDDNYIVIQGWMVNNLKLGGTQLILYAIIYGFTQDDESLFTGSLKYLQIATGKSRTAIVQNLKKLENRGLIVKISDKNKGVVFNSYKTVPPYTNSTPPRY